MRIFGGILPFVGWRVVNVDNDGNPCEEASHWEGDALEIEWLGVGAIVYIGKVRATTTNDVIKGSAR